MCPAASAKRTVMRSARSGYSATEQRSIVQRAYRKHTAFGDALLPHCRVGLAERAALEDDLEDRPRGRPGAHRSNHRLDVIQHRLEVLKRATVHRGH